MMDLMSLADKLRKQLQSSSQIIIDDTVLSGEIAEGIRTAFALGGKNLTVDGLKPADIPDPSDGKLRINAGTSSLLGCASAPVNTVFTGLPDKLEIIVTAQMPPAWTFETSFSNLAFFPFNILKPQNALFIYTSEDQPAYPLPGDPSTAIPLAAGLNFLADLGLTDFTGIAGVLGSLVDSRPYKFYGPFSPVGDAVYPVGSISAHLGDHPFKIGADPFSLTLAEPAVGVRITQPEDGIQYVDMMIESNLNDKLDFCTGISEADDALVFTAEPLPGKTFTADDIINILPGGAGFKQYIPDVLHEIFSEVGLKNFTMVIDTSTSQKVSFISLSIGTVKPWTIIPDILTLEDLTLRLSTSDPGGASASTDVSISATAEFLHENIFTDGKFEFDITLTKGNDSKWNVSAIDGKYSGKVTLGNIVRGIAGPSVSVPDELQNITFSDFGISVVRTEGTYTYTVYGSCEAAFPLFGRQLTAATSVVFSKAGHDTSVDFSGNISIGEQNFKFAIQFASGTSKEIILSASWSTAGSYLELEDITSAFGFDIPQIPPELDLALKSADFHYDFTKKTIVLDAVSANYGQAAFVAVGNTPPEEGGGSAYIFSLVLNFDLNLSDLPLVGKIFNGQKLGEIKNIKVLFASADVTADQVSGFNKLLPEPVFPTPEDASGSDAAIRKGFNFSADITLGGNPIPLSAGGDTAPVAKTPTPAPAPETPVPPAGNATWINIKKSIGPVTLDRIGVRYEDGRVWLLIDGSFMLSTLSFSLQGLGMSFRLSRDNPDPTFQLDGMSLMVKAGSMEIGGGFLNFSGDYLGNAVVKAASFSLTAVGGYAISEEAFFIFLRLDAPLGGPPYFYITGLAGGFGINRSLLIPAVGQLPQFPLLPQNNTFPLKLDPSDPKGSLSSVLEKTAAYIHPQSGEYWLAAGIDFTSFEMIDASALLTVSFGVNLEIALLGICHVTVPKLDPEPIVYIEIALEARFLPASGLIAVDGYITPASFVFSELCRISGGFAFYIWYSGDHEGEFVVSIGGYHPHFKKPDYFPSVPRLQIIYQVGSLMMKGECYFALTSHAVMAGFMIQATWQCGCIKAWFDAGIDFLLGWRPFHYEAEAYIHLGASFTLNLLFTSVSITIHVGIDLDVWGPPFGGKAVIDLDIISFTIRFGADQRRETVTWDSFKESFLPKSGDKTKDALKGALNEAASGQTDADLCTAGISSGLIKDLKAKDEKEFFNWIVDPDFFIITSKTIIPSKECNYNDFAVNNPFGEGSAFTFKGQGTPGETPVPKYDRTSYPDGISWNNTFGVLPMGLDGTFSTVHSVQVRKLPEGKDYTDPANYTDDVNDLSVTPVLKNSQAALWAPADPGLNGGRLIENTLTGLQISPMIQQPEITLKADLWKMLFDETNEIELHYSSPEIAATDSFDAQISPDGSTLSFDLNGRRVTCSNYELSALTDPAAETARKDIADNLALLGLTVNTEPTDVSGLSAYPLWDWPLIRLLGEEVYAG